ncbi:MAG: A24 family peptidase [bacterium]|nr:A24 family peptidase [bacterium]MDE0351765.1 A24 family peptidase [bacterium]
MPLYLVAGVLGLFAGRLLVSLIRAELDRAPFRSAMACRPACGCPVRPADFVPLWWWAGSRDRDSCSRCHRPAGAFYRLVEPVTAIAWAGTVGLVGVRWTLASFLWMVAVTVVLSFVDVRSYRLPNRVLVPGTVVGLLLLSGGALVDGRIGDVPEALASGLGYSVALLIPALVTRGAIGMGDVKLALLLGLFAGYTGWETAVAALVGAFLLAGAVGVLLLALRRITRHDHLPFGPFMVAGAWLAIAF